MRRSVSWVLSAVVLGAASAAGSLVFPGLQPQRAVAATSARPPAAPVQPTRQSRGGVTISPAFQQVTLLPDKPSTEYDFTVRNNTATEQEFALSVVDFGTLDESGGVLFAGNAKKTFSYRYALSPWVQLEKDRVVVPARSAEKVPITLLNKESLTPGGHYGAILVTPTESGGAGERVQIDQVASSLLFVKKRGGEVYRLSLNRIAVRTHVFSLPTSVTLRFQNSGNVHVIPRGLISVTDPRGRLVARGVINEDSGIALPESFRQVPVTLRGMSRAWLPGRYTITTSYRYDDQATTTTTTTSFVYLNASVLIAAVVGAAILIAFGTSRRLRRRVFGRILRLRCRRGSDHTAA